MDLDHDYSDDDTDSDTGDNNNDDDDENNNNNNDYDNDNNNDNNNDDNNDNNDDDNDNDNDNDNDSANYNNLTSYRTTSVPTQHASGNRVAKLVVTQQVEGHHVARTRNLDMDIGLEACSKILFNTNSRLKQL